MADEQSREVIGYTVDVNVEEALSGLKAIERQAKSAKKAIAELGVTQYKTDDKIELHESVEKGKIRITNLSGSYNLYRPLSGQGVKLRLGYEGVKPEELFNDFHSDQLIAELKRRGYKIERGLTISSNVWTVGIEKNAMPPGVMTHGKDGSTLEHEDGPYTIFNDKGWKRYDKYGVLILQKNGYGLSTTIYPQENK